MRSSHYAILGLLLLTALTGCVSVKSNVDPQFDEQVESVFIVSRSHSSIDRFVNGLTQAMASRLARQGVRVEYHISDPMSLELEQGVDAKVDEFGADAVLLIVPTERSTVDGLNKAVTMDFSLIPVGGERIAWRADVRSEGSGFGDLGNTTEIADKAVDKMLEDGLRLGIVRAGTPAGDAAP
ncbi:MAG: hypothetical protein AAGF99_05275 [Bacteroidota bacterium]